MYTINYSKEELEELLKLIANEMNYLAKVNKYRTEKYYTLQEIYRKVSNALYES